MVNKKQVKKAGAKNRVDFIVQDVKKNYLNILDEFLKDEVIYGNERDILVFIRVVTGESIEQVAQDIDRHIFTVINICKIEYERLLIFKKKKKAIENCIDAIEIYNLSTRAYKRLVEMGIKTKQDVVYRLMMHCGELQIDGIGKGTEAEIIKKMKINKADIIRLKKELEE